MRAGGRAQPRTLEPLETQVYDYSVRSGESVMSGVSHGASDIDERPCSHEAMSQTMCTVPQMRGGGRAQPRTLEPLETQVHDYSNRSGDIVMSHALHGASDIDERPCSHGAMPQTMDSVHQMRGGGRAQPRTLEPLETQVHDYSNRRGERVLSHVSYGASDIREALLS